MATKRKNHRPTAKNTEKIMETQKVTPIGDTLTKETTTLEQTSTDAGVTEGVSRPSGFKTPTLPEGAEEKEKTEEKEKPEETEKTEEMQDGENAAAAPHPGNVASKTESSSAITTINKLVLTVKTLKTSHRSGPICMQLAEALGILLDTTNSARDISVVAHCYSSYISMGHLTESPVSYFNKKGYNKQKIKSLLTINSAFYMLSMGGKGMNMEVINNDISSKPVKQFIIGKLND